MRITNIYFDTTYFVQFTYLIHFFEDISKTEAVAKPVSISHRREKRKMSGLQHFFIIFPFLLRINVAPTAKGILRLFQLQR